MPLCDITIEETSYSPVLGIQKYKLCTKGYEFLDIFGVTT
jgi:hypothetical protein